MATFKTEVRSGVYYDSAKLMSLQRSLAGLPGVLDAGVVMGTDSNKELLAHIGLDTPEVKATKPDDLAIVIKAENEKAALDALAQVDGLLAARKGGSEQEYQPRSIESATDMLPDAEWVIVSVAGRYATAVTREALRLRKHVHLFSDNVSVENEIELKKEARDLGLLVMGPDCGTAMVDGYGLAFANKIRKGPIGIVAAAGTGLQQVATRIHQLNSGITFGIGTGGRDLKAEVGAITFLMALDVLARDDDTKVIVLTSKPPSPKVAEEVLKVARKAGKPVVVNFIARPITTTRDGNLFFATGLDDAARLAVELAHNPPKLVSDADLPIKKFTAKQKYLRGLFSGGTLAYEAQHILYGYIPRVLANSPINKEFQLPDAFVSQENCIVDLGEDEFTQGRLHPMMDNELRIRRLYEEAKDPEVAVILLDVVIGYGSHPDPASEIAPAIAKCIADAKKDGRHLEVVCVVCGTDEDPQNLNNQMAQLKAAGALVDTSNEVICRYVGRILRALAERDEPKAHALGKPVDLEKIKKPLAAINVGLESFAANLKDQGAPYVQVDWKPPAGGNEKLMNILQKMKSPRK
ncbi:MAG TPA: acyl-CoA synthetase FdrA [Anaerolineaceae bacterium]|jgi:FdrA protein|nr:acyl-CoA synthetase FdrA [Chloroflexota bacterium]HNS07426.1 acyl-CoA synthetase FdrA [Anaerolineaceae bacterium]HNW13235.1 acyl-CoA synthetase FdrA [Anaerolineaceae bacterium]HUM62421.1 acyl-CoA synthetase FdrA [Anaerolineaceae bacterium]